MSKLKCICENIIIDQTDDLSYKAYFVRDQNIEKLFDAIDVIELYIKAIETNKREEWQRDFYKANMKILKDSNVVSDILTGFRGKFESVMYQCENCGRLHIQRGDENEFVLFKPEDSNGNDILKGI